MWGNRLFCNCVEKMIPWGVAKKNTMEKLLKPNPLCINAKLQMPVYVNGPIVLINVPSELYVEIHVKKHGSAMKVAN